MTAVRLLTKLTTLCAIVALVCAQRLSMRPLPLPRDERPSTPGSLSHRSRIQGRDTSTLPANVFTKREIEALKRRDGLEQNADGSWFIWMPQDTYAGKTFFE